MSYFLQIKNVSLFQNLLAIRQVKFENIQPTLTVFIQPDDKIKINLLKHFITAPQAATKKDQTLKSNQSLVQILINQRFKIIKFQLTYLLNTQDSGPRILKKQFSGELLKSQIQKHMITCQSLQKQILLQNILKSDEKDTEGKILTQNFSHLMFKQSLEDLQLAKLQCSNPPQLLIKISYNPMMKYLGKAQILRSFEQNDQNMEKIMQNIKKEAIKQNSQYKSKYSKINDFQQAKISDESNENNKSKAKIVSKIGQEYLIAENNALNKNLKMQIQKEDEDKQINQISQIMLQTKNHQKNSIPFIQQNSIHLTQLVWNEQGNAQEAKLSPQQLKPQIDQKSQKLSNISKKQNQETPQSQAQQIKPKDQRKKKKSIFNNKNELSFNHISINKSSPIYRQLNDMYKLCCSVQTDSKLQKILNQNSQLLDPHHQ